MEKLKTRNEYVGCNRKCRFYGDSIEATSYGHWTFVKVINGKVIFNDYNYSKTTRNHQWTIRSLLRNLGIKIDAEVNFRSSLTEWTFREDALESFYENAIKKIVQNNTKRVRKKTIEENKDSINSIKKDIQVLKEIGAEISFKDIYRIYKNFKKERDSKENFLLETKDIIGKIYKDSNSKRVKVTGKNNTYQRISFVTLNEKYNHNDHMNFKWFNDRYKPCKLSNVLSA